jgi:hypothetical protein
VLSLLPDIDVVGMAYGVRYAAVASLLVHVDVTIMRAGPDG